MAAVEHIKRYESLLNEWDKNNFLERVGNQDPDVCWIWPGAKGSEGYGTVSKRFEGKSYTLFAHRIMFMIHNGEVPVGLVVDHHCHTKNLDNCLPKIECKHRACVNPNHLRAITKQENSRIKRAYRDGRFPESAYKNRREKKGTCKQGHLWIEENMITRKSGKVDCAVCRKIQNSKQKVGV